MAEAYEYLIGGIICLIISVVASIMQNRISAPSLVGIGLFVYGVYKTIQARNKNEEKDDHSSAHLIKNQITF